jgi:hypothetical protein
MTDEITGRRLAEMITALWKADPALIIPTTAEDWDIILPELKRGDDPRDIADRISRARYERQGLLDMWEPVAEREARWQQEQEALKQQKREKRQAKRGPTAEAIRAEFRAKAKQVHPDVGGSNEEFRKLVAERDAALRRRSDALGRRRS